jgi:NAD(P)-dependent dehydrogenase (short-subunit alcohol dehydrogenase family)
MAKFEGKTAIVTGGSGALGTVIAEQFFDLGACIAIPYHSDKSLTSIPKKISSAKAKTQFIKTDLTDESEVQSFVDDVVKSFGTLDYLINAAGGYSGGDTIDEVSTDEFDNMLNLNLRTTFFVCRNVLQVMRKQRAGRIVNIAAMPAVTPSAKKGSYAISKRGVITLTETIAEEVKGSGITANAIAPSTILTMANKESMPNADFKKWVTPEEIAQLAIYLCSDEAKSVNGNVIKIYGGV